MTGIPFGKYQLVKRLARGGMAEVFLARQRGPEGFQRLVAVKRILPHLVDAQDFVRMFLDEARLAAQLTHPNVVHVYDFGRVDEHYFIAMEYVDGVHAGVLIQHAERGRLPDVLVARIGADACAGLHYAHELRDAEGRMLHIVHRDVSPPNLLVSYDGSMKLVDFGIAKAVSSIEQTRPGVVKGKFAYMSPEQTVGHKLDGRSDVFSLGVVLWELLAAKLMVPRLDPVEGMRMLRDGRLPPIEQERPDIAPELAAAIGRALTTESEDRCTALELGRALEEFIKGSADGIGSTLELAEWVRVRFPREGPSGSYPEEDDVPAATRPVTGATQTVLRVPDRPTMQLPQAALAALAARMTGAHAAPEPAPAQESLAGQAEARGGVGGRGEEDDRLFAVESSSIIVAPEWLMDDGGSHDFDTVDVQEHDTVTEAADEADDDAEAETHDFRRPHVHTGRDVTRTVLPGDSEVTRAVPPGEVARTIGRHSVEGETIWRGFRRPGTQLAHKAGRIALVIASGAAIAVSAISLVAQLRGAARSGREQESQATLANPSPSAKATQPSSMAALAPSPNAAPNPSPNAAPNPSPNAAPNPSPNAAANPNAPPTPNPNAALNPNANAALNPSPNPSPNAAANPNAAPRPGAGANPSANAAAPPAAAAAAIIDVVTTPRGARVVLDDQAPVRSPIRFQGLRPGAHRLRVSLRGYQSLERTFAVSVGEHRAIEMDLVAERSAGRGERRSAESRRASRAPTSGVLKVRTRPYCEVYLDGHRLGQTPLVTELKPGRYTLVFKHPGKPRQRRTATVRAGEETRLDFALE